MDEPGRCRHVRVKVDRPLKFRNETGEFYGQLGDISYSGAAVNSEILDFGDRANLELSSEDFGHLSGGIARSFKDDIALSFDIDHEAKYQLVEQISGRRSDKEYV
jgi:hypothetical protein